MKHEPIDIADARPVTLNHSSLVALAMARAAATPTARAQGRLSACASRPAASFAPSIESANGKAGGNPDPSGARQVLAPERPDRPTDEPAPDASQRDRS